MTTIVTEEEARRFVEGFGDDAAMARLSRFAGMLSEENERQNLVARATLESVWLRHLADSAQLLEFVDGTPSGPWLDLGTGAGFPGLVIAALRPEWTVRLVESRKRRVDWLERVRSELQLQNCQVIGARLELVESFPCGVISARAFAPLPRLLDLSARFSTRDTLWLLPKGRSAAQDLASLPDSMRRLFHVEHSRTGSGAGIVVGRLEQTKGR